MQKTRARGAGGGPRPPTRRLALLLPLAAAALAAGAIAVAYVDHGPPDAAMPPAGDVHGPEWPWPWPSDPWTHAATAPSLLPEAEARRVTYLTASFRVTNYQTITVTFNAPIYAQSSDYTGLRIDSGNGLEPRTVCGLSGPYQTRGWSGIRTTPSQTHTLTVCGDGKPDGGRLPTSATGRINVDQLYYFYAGNIFDGNSVHRYFLRSSNVFVADGQAPSLATSGNGAPHLDLERAVLRLGLNERMDASRINLHGITLSCTPPSGTGTVALGNMSGATLPVADASTVEIVLSPEQKTDLSAADAGQCDRSQWRVSLGPSTLFDAAGNAMPPAPGVALGVTRDNVAPGLSGNPSLDLSTGVMTVRFTEYVKAVDNADGRIDVERDPSGATVLYLVGASVDVSGDTATITLTEDQRLTLVREHARGQGLAVDIPVSGRVFVDLAEPANEFDGSGNSTINVVPDRSPPGLLAGTPPSLDLNGVTGNLTFAFDESVDVGATNLTGVRLLGPGSSVLAALDGLERDVGVGGGTEFPVGGYTYSASVKVVLNSTLRADSLGAARITAPPGAFSDASGNAHPGLSAFPLNVTADTTRPLVVSGPVLDLNDGTLNVTLSEFVGKVRPWGIVLRDMTGVNNTVLGGAAVLQPPPPGGQRYTDTVIVNLTRGQAAAAVVQEATRIEANPSVFEDLSGNPFRDGFPGGLTVVNDTTKPVLDGSRPPVLNIGVGTLAVSFTEYVDASAVNATGITVKQSSGPAQTLALDGAERPVADGDTLVLNLTTAQSNMLGGWTPRPDLIDIDNGSFADMSGNKIDADTNIVIRDTTDNELPRVAATPSLDLGTLNLTITFTKRVNAPAMDLSGIVVEGLDGGNRTHLTGASPPSATGTMAVIGITEDQKASIILANATNGPVRINMSSSVVSDVTGNAFAGHAGPLVLDPDEEPPGIDDTMPPLLDLSTGSLTVWFDEHVNASRTVPAKVNLASPAQGSQNVGLNGAQVLLPGSTPQYSVTLLLTLEQKADAVTRNSSWITTTGTGAFFDLAGVPIEHQLDGIPFGTGEYRQVGFEIRVVEDDVKPRLLAGVQPRLNMSDGTLILRFDEHVAAAGALPGLVELAADAPSGQPRIALGSSAVSIPYDPIPGSLPPTSSDTIVVTLSPHEKAVAAAATASGGLVVVVGPGAFFDVSGNPNVAQTASLELDTDTALPGIDSAELDLGAGILEVRFDEYVDAPSSNLSRVSLSSAGGGACASGIGLAGASASPGVGAHAAAPPGTSTALVVALTAAQKAAAAACWTAPETRSIEVSAHRGAFMDLAGSGNEGYSGTAIVLSDAAAPRLNASAPPLLDLDDGTLAVRFDEYVNASAADPSLVSLSSAGGGACASGIGLAGASASPDPTAASGAPDAPPGASPVAVISLTEAQRAAAAACWTAPETRSIEVSALRGAFPDVSWNPSAAFAGARASVDNDTTAPLLLADSSARPPPILLNLNARTISFTFNEHVGAASANSSRVNVTDALGSLATLLSGASVRGSGGPTLVLSLSQDMVSSITSANFSNGPVRANIGSGAFSDVSGNPIAGVNGRAVSFSDDTTPPVLDGSPMLYLGNGTLTARFNEPLAASAVNVSEISVHPVPPSDAAASVQLAGAAVVEGGGPSAIVLALTPDQKAASMAAHALGGSAELQMAPGSVADLAFNGIEGTSATLAVMPDRSPPALSAARPPRLDLGDGVLTLRFDEHVSAPSPNASRMWLLPVGVPAPGVAGAVGLADAAVITDDPDSDVIRVRLTPDLKAASVAAQRVLLEAGAVSDLSNNPTTSDLAAALSVARDLAAPRLDDSALPILNLSSGVLTVAFDEHVDASSANLSRLSVVGAPGSAAVELGGANLTSGDGAGIAVRLTPSQRAAASVADAAPGPVRLVAREAGALLDLSGNPLGAFGPSPMLVVPDTAGPVVEDAGDRRPKLDLGTGILTVSFDERVDSGASNLSAVRLVTTGGTVVARLGGYGAAAPVTDDASLAIDMSPSDLNAVISGALDEQPGSTDRCLIPPNIPSNVRTSIRLEAGAGAFYDALGHPSAPLTATEFRVVADQSGPSLDAALLNTADGSIVLTFNEGIYHGANDLIRGVNVVNASGYDADLRLSSNIPVDDRRVKILPEESRVSGVAAAGEGARILLNTGTFRDLSCNTFDSQQRAAMSTASDNSPPQMLGYPELDMGSGNLTMLFDEQVDAAGVSALAVSLSNRTGWQVQLGGAAVSTPDGGAASDTIRMSLTPSQKHAAAVANQTGPIHVSIKSTAVHDLSYRYYEGLVNGSLDVTPDTLPPRMLGAHGDLQRRPTLDIPARTLTVHFDEYVDASSARPERMGVAAGASSPRGLHLNQISAVEAVAAPGSPVAGAFGQSLAVTLVEADVLDAVVWEVTHLNASDDAFSDAAGNSAADGPVRMLVIRDSTPPSLSSSELNLGSGELKLTFDEAVNASAGHASGITIQGSRSVDLAYSNVEAGAGSRGLNETVVVRLALPDKAAAAVSLPSRLLLATGAFADASHNPVNNANVTLGVTNDMVPPGLGRDPVLDLAAGKVWIYLDEYVNATTARPLLANLSGAGAQHVALSGALSESPWLPPPPPGAAPNNPLLLLLQDPDAVGAPAFEVDLTERQRSAAAVLWSAAARDQPIRLVVPANAFSDLVGRGNAYDDTRGLNVMRDDTGPALDVARPPVLHLGNGTLTVWLDEYANASDTETSEIEIAWGPDEHQRVRLAGADPSEGPGSAAGGVPPLPSGASLSVNIELEPAQKAEADILERQGGVARLVADASAFRDLSGNRSPEREDFPLAVNPDRTPPRLDGDPLLNLAARKLVLTFDEYVDAGNVNTSKIEVVGDGAGAPRVALGNSTVLGPNGTSITLDLDAGQLAGIANANASSPPVRLDMANGSVRDLSGNNITRVMDATLAVTSDAESPVLSGQPALDLNDGTLLLKFSEPVRDVDDLSQMNLTAVAGAAGAQPPPPAGLLGLGGATLTAPAPDTVAIGLTPPQKAYITAAYLAAGGAPGGAQIVLDIGAGAVEDLAFNGIGAVRASTVHVTQDTTPPEPDRGSHDLELGGGTLAVRFVEHVNTSATRTYLLNLTLGTGVSPVSLEGATPAPSPATGSQLVNVTLTQAQKAKVVIADAAPGAARLVAGHDAFWDLSNIPSREASVPLLVAPDETPPRLVADRDPLLNLATGILALRFDEYVKAGSVNASAIEVVVGGGAARVDLDGATVSDLDSASITLNLTAGRLGEINNAIGPGGAPQPVLLAMAPAAVLDLSDNGIAGVPGVALATTRDAKIPEMSGQPALDLNDGTLLLKFSEPVLAGVDLSRMNLTAVAGAAGAQPPPPAGLLGLGGATLTAPAPDTVAIGLTPPQKAAIAVAYLAAGGAPGGAQIVLDIGAGAVEDLAFNGIGAVRDRTVDVTPDRTPPTGVSHRLDLGSGALEVRFDEHVNTTATRTGLLSLSGGAGDSLAGASVAPSPAAGSQLVNVTLTPAQKAVALEAERLEAAPGAFTDLSGNPSGRANETLAVAPDGAPPRLAAGSPPLLNLAAGTLTLTFDEYVEAESVDALRMTIRDAGGDEAAVLAGARIDGPVRDDVTLSMTADQAAAVSGAHGSDPPVSLDLAQGAVRDLSGNGFAGASGVELATTSDAVRPGLSDQQGPSLDLNDGALLVRFSEPVDAGRIALERFAIALAGTGGLPAPGAAASSVRLGGADLDASRAADDGSVAIVITAAQKAFADGAASAGAAIELRIEAGAVYDLARNRNDNASAQLAVTPDTSPPAPSDERRPDLDLNGGTLRIEFDEYIDAESVRPGLVSVAGTALGGANASVSGVAVMLALTPAQKAAAVLASSAGIGDAAALSASGGGAVTVTIAAGAVADLSGNAAGMHAGLDVRTVPDTTPPRLLESRPPVFDAAAATLALAFDEYVNASTVAASGIVAEDSSGGSRVTLEDAAARGPDSALVVLDLSAGHVAGIAAAQAAAPPVRLDMAPGSLRDLSGNAFAGADDVRARLAATPAPPTPPDGGGGGTAPPPPPPAGPVVQAAPSQPAAVFTGGGGGGGRTLVAQPGGAPDSVAIRSVSWDCEAGSATVVLGGARAAEADVRIATASGSAWAVPADAPPGGGAAYSASFAGDRHISVRVEVAEGGTVRTLFEAVGTGGQCAGEAVVAPPSAAPAPGAGAGAARAQPEPRAAGGGADGPARDLGEPPVPPGAGGPEPGRDGAEPPAADKSGPGAEPAPEPPPEGQQLVIPPPPPDDREPAAGAGGGQEPPTSETGTDAGDDAGAAGSAPGEAPAAPGGGCLVATAAYGTELAPQVQLLREVRDASLASTAHGSALLAAFNTAYYAFSPHVADLERSSPAVRAAVGAAIAPMVWLLHAAAQAGEGHGAGDALAALAAAGVLAAAVAAVAVRTGAAPLRRPLKSRPAARAP